MQRSNLPYGDAFIVQTPSLDKASALLYQQDQQRRQQMSQYGASMDDSLMKQLGNVKNVDIPEIMQAFGEYKDARKNTLFNRRLQNDPNAYAQAQIVANEKLGNLYKQINASRENKDFLTNVRKDMETHPHEYDDDTAPQEWSRQMNTKTGDLKNAGDVTPFRWGGPKTDFQGISKKSAGTPRKFAGEEKPFGDVQVETPQYEAGATPGQFYQSFVGSLSTHDAGKDASKLWGTIPQATIDAVNKQYDSIAPETMKLWTGSEKAPLPEPSTDAEKFAQFNTKLYAINNLPKTLPSQFRTNQGDKLKLQNDLSTQKGVMMENLRNGHIRGRAEFRHTLGQMDKEDQPLAVDQYLQGLEERSQKGGVGEFSIDKKPMKGNDMELAPPLVEQFERKDAGGHTVQPDMIKRLDNGDMVGIFFKRDATDNNPIRGANGKYVISSSLPPVTLSRAAVLAGMTEKLAPKAAAVKHLVKPEVVKEKKTIPGF